MLTLSPFGVDFDHLVDEFRLGVTSNLTVTQLYTAQHSTHRQRREESVRGSRGEEKRYSSGHPASERRGADPSLVVAVCTHHFQVATFILTKHMNTERHDERERKRR